MWTRSKSVSYTHLRQTLYSYVEKRIFARLTNKDLPFKGSRQKKKTKHIRRMKSAAKGDSCLLYTSRCV